MECTSHNLQRSYWESIRDFQNETAQGYQKGTPRKKASILTKSREGSWRMVNEHEGNLWVRLDADCEREEWSLRGCLFGGSQGRCRCLSQYIALCQWHWFLCFGIAFRWGVYGTSHRCISVEQRLQLRNRQPQLAFLFQLSNHGAKAPPSRRAFFLF